MPQSDHGSPEYLSMHSASLGSASPALEDRAHKRVVNINGHQPYHYCNNLISTAKYSLVSFLPKFLFEQFRRYANIFFLFIALLQQIPNVSPTGRYTTAVPLLFILLMSALKEIIEDVKRHSADGKINNRMVLVLRNGDWSPQKWINVAVGDIIKIVNHQFFPADIIILSSSEPQGMCYIETSNLDGETNLKIRQGVPQTADILTHQHLQDLSGLVECELPNRHLYEFVGTIRLSGLEAIPLGPDQLLLRGAMLKNTKWLFGIVVYTGHESKLMLNSTAAPLKRSTVEKVINKQIIMLFFVLLTLALVSTISSEVWTSAGITKYWYLGYDETDSDKYALASNNFGLNFLTFIILFNNLIPISLQVTIELVKFIQAMFINWDIDMYAAETDTPAMARTSNLNEELGQVKYIFTDKTGTLTRNVMDLRKCSVAGTLYGENQETSERFSDPALLNDLGDGNTTASVVIRDFLTLLAVCHTVVPERDADDPTMIHYQASSPDERALVLGAKRLGFTFTIRTPNYVKINVFDKEEKYQILNVLEFTSTRKRMSVIVRGPNRKIKLMMKGADNVVFERLAKEQLYLDSTLAHLKAFATEGLRTLCIAEAHISEEFYTTWKQQFYEASIAIEDREKQIEDVSELIEKELVLLGATAIEDKLQEGVPESIANLAKANIKIWVLTGDKQETAINIGYSSRLLTATMPLVIINEENLDNTRECLQSHAHDFGARLRMENDVGLVIDGQTLKFALSYDCRQHFLDIALSCRAVIACRVSPLQKAELVELVKTEVESITLAIGDGANDVGMIQAAHVGIGISGMEGLQAACASDYTIGQFRFLNKLLLVHGAWSYSRLTRLILYSFYKNICLYLIEFWFAIESGFSGQIIFERWSIALYNVFFTAVPPLALGLFDRHADPQTLTLYPHLYKISQNSELFNVKIFWMWCLNAVYHSVLLFWLTRIALQQDIAFKDGKIGDYLFMGNIVYTYVVVTVCLKSGLETTAWTWFTHLSIWGSIACWFVFLAIYSNVWPVIDLGCEMVGMERYIFSCAIFWIGLILIPFATLLRDFVCKVLRRSLHKTIEGQVEVIDQQVPTTSSDPKLRIQVSNSSSAVLRVTETARLLKNVFVRSRAQSSSSPLGFAFSQEEHGAVSQSVLIRRYDTTLPKPEGL